ADAFMPAEDAPQEPLSVVGEPGTGRSRLAQVLHRADHVGSLLRSAPRPPPEGSALDRGDDTLDKIEPAEGVGAAAQKVECRTVRGRVKAADKGSIINKALQDLVWVEAEEAPQRGLPQPDSLPHLAEPFFCAFKQLASQGNGERSTMPQGGRLLTHTRPGRTINKRKV